MVRLRALPVVSLLFLAPAAHADIYKCEDEQGNVAYLQTPCPAVEDDDPLAAEAEQDEYVPESTPQPQSSETQVPSSRQPGEKLEDCKKRYRDQIDVIDEEMRTDFSTEQGESYKEELLALTQQLRACGFP